MSLSELSISVNKLYAFLEDYGKNCDAIDPVQSTVKVLKTAIKVKRPSALICSRNMSSAISELWVLLRLLFKAGPWSCKIMLVRGNTALDGTTIVLVMASLWKVVFVGSILRIFMPVAEGDIKTL